MVRYASLALIPACWMFYTQVGSAASVEWNALAAQQEGLTVYIHDFSDLNQSILRTAARDAESIFKRAGLTIRVVLDPMLTVNGELRPARNFEFSPSDLVANIITAPMADSLRVSENVLGVAPGAGIEGRNLVHIFAHRVHDLYRLQARETLRGNQIWIASEGRILAYALAHEIGHLLLNRPQHSRIGIMRGNWSLYELRMIGASTFDFSREEKRQLQAEAMRRSSQARRNSGASSSVPPAGLAE